MSIKMMDVSGFNPTLIKKKEIVTKKKTNFYSSQKFQIYEYVV